MYLIFIDVLIQAFVYLFIIYLFFKIWLVCFCIFDTIYGVFEIYVHDVEEVLCYLI